MLKGQDIMVLAGVIDNDRPAETYAELGKRVCLSASEAHSAVKRLTEAALIGNDRKVIKRNVLEFLLHGLRYSFPFRQTAILAKGMPTSYAAPVAKGMFAVSGNPPVWQSPDGTAYGRAVEPLYATAPKAAANDVKLYDNLAIIDMLRGGRLRERQFAERKLREMLS